MKALTPAGLDSNHSVGPSCLSVLLSIPIFHSPICKMGKVIVFDSCAVLSHSVMSNSVSPWAVALQAPLSMGILQARALQWVGPGLLQGNLPNPGTEPRSRALQADSLPSEPPRKPSLSLASLILVFISLVSLDSNRSDLVSLGKRFKGGMYFLKTYSPV